MREREDVGACNSVLSDQNMVCMYFKKSNAVTLDKKVFFWLCATTEARIFISKEKTKNIWIKKILF